MGFRTNATNQIWLMYLYKITLTVSGDNFTPLNLDMTRVNESMIRNSLTSDTDLSWNPETNAIDEQVYGYGGIMYRHTQLFVEPPDFNDHINQFVSFLEENDDFFAGNGATEYNFFTEFYYSGPQCNFEVMDSESLKRIKQLKTDAVYPVSVYKMKKKELKELYGK